LADGDKLEQEVYGEGIVVMKNEDNVLPLAQGSNITVFGKNSNTNNIRASLEVAGYNVNPTLKSFYASSALSGAGRGAYDAPGNGNTVPGYLTGETPVSMYRETEINSFADYSDAAVVILYRMAGEGNDSARTMMWDGTQFKIWNENSTQLVPGARNKDDHYL
jgi:beta-glucosidase